MSKEGDKNEWFIVKNGLYYREIASGYTGIRDEAWCLPYLLAEEYDKPEYGVSIVPAKDAPEFSEACYGDVKFDYIMKQRTKYKAEIEELEAKLHRQFFGIGNPPEPVAHPSEEWCSKYADWHESYFGSPALSSTGGGS